MLSSAEATVAAFQNALDESARLIIEGERGGAFEPPLQFSHGDQLLVSAADTAQFGRDVLVEEVGTRLKGRSSRRARRGFVRPGRRHDSPLPARTQDADRPRRRRAPLRSHGHRAVHAHARAQAGTRCCSAAGLEPLGLHEARHTYVSLMHAAGNSLEEIGDFVGHSTTYMVDRYRHLLEGQRERAADRLDAFLAGPCTGARADALC